MRTSAGRRPPNPRRTWVPSRVGTGCDSRSSWRDFITALGQFHLVDFTRPTSSASLVPAGPRHARVGLGFVDRKSAGDGPACQFDGRTGDRAEFALLGRPSAPLVDGDEMVASFGECTKTGTRRATVRDGRLDRRDDGFRRAVGVGQRLPSHFHPAGGCGGPGVFRSRRLGADLLDGGRGDLDLAARSGLADREGGRCGAVVEIVLVFTADPLVGRSRCDDPDAVAGPLERDARASHSDVAGRLWNLYGAVRVLLWRDRVGRTL